MEVTKMAKTIQVCICMTEEQHEALQELAKSEDRSVSNLIRVWIAEHKAKQG